MIDLRIEEVKNGFNIKVGDDFEVADTYIARTQDDVAEVVKSILRGAFKDGEAPKTKVKLGSGVEADGRGAEEKGRKGT